MKYAYIAVTVKQDRNANAFESPTSKNPNFGYYSYVVKCSEEENIVFKLNCIGGLQCANIFQSKKRAAEVVEHWNACHKINGQYLFDEVWADARAV